MVDIVIIRLKALRFIITAVYSSPVVYVVLSERSALILWTWTGTQNLDHYREKL